MASQPRGSEGDDVEAEGVAAEVGLCATCRHARVQSTARGRSFWRCARADGDPRFMRYPPLPVRHCQGHEARAPGSERSAGGATRSER